MDVCLRVLKERNKTRFDSYSVRNNVLTISHITFRDCRVHTFSDNLSRTSCISFFYLLTCRISKTFAFIFLEFIDELQFLDKIPHLRKSRDHKMAFLFYSNNEFQSRI